MHKLS